MLAKLKALFASVAEPERGGEFEVHQLAAAALLVEAAMLDGQFGEEERGQIEAGLREVYGLSEAECSALIAKAAEAAAESVEWQSFTAAIKAGCDHDERIQIVEMLWRVVLADEELHDYEASLIRRITGLLYVTGRESAQARERARAALNSGSRMPI